MSFQAYLDAVEDKTGKTPQELIDLAAERGYGADTKAGEIVEWFKTDFGVGRGHAIGDGPRDQERAWHRRQTRRDHRDAPRRIQHPSTGRQGEPNLTHHPLAVYVKTARF
jgi:hypothetical protein